MRLIALPALAVFILAPLAQAIILSFTATLPADGQEVGLSLIHI